MELSAKGAAFVRLHEGFVGHYYLDAVGVPTIGIGFTWRSAAFRAWWTRNRAGVAFAPGAKMTRAEAESALIEVCRAEYGKAVDTFLAKVAPQNVFDGMASVCFNCGPGSLKWKWAAKAKAGDYDGSAALLATTAVTAKGKRLAGLVRRRKEEGLLIAKGVYTGVPGKVEAIAPAPAAVADKAMGDGMLVRGERGPAVAALIKDLAALGFYKGTLDDLFGYGTEAAVLAFQRANHLTADGKAGTKTLAALKAATKALL